MRKKLLSLVLAVMMVVAASGVASAVIMRSPDARLKTETWTGTSAAASVITAQNRIVGFSVTGSAAAIAGFYDTDALGTASDALLFDEASAASTAYTLVWYPAPKELTTGLTVVVNASTTIVTVYYE